MCPFIREKRKEDPNVNFQVLDEFKQFQIWSSEFKKYEESERKNEEVLTSVIECFQSLFLTSSCGKAARSLEKHPLSTLYDKAILEIELRDEDEEVRLPQEIRVLKEVTNDPEYKNAALARLPQYL